MLKIKCLNTLLQNRKKISSKQRFLYERKNIDSYRELIANCLLNP